MPPKLDEQTDLQWVGKKLRELRIKRGLTLQGMGERMGVAHSQISDTESARYGLKLETLLRLLRALGVTPREFFEDMPIHKEIGEGTREEQRKRHSDLAKAAKLSPSTAKKVPASLAKELNAGNDPAKKTKRNS